MELKWRKSLAAKLQTGIERRRKNRMEQIIGEYQIKIELVLGNNDDMALEAVAMSYKKLNYTSAALPAFLRDRRDKKPVCKA